MNANDVTLLTRMATDMSTIATATKTQGEAITALATRVQALEEEHGVPEADTAPISQILATLEGSAGAVAQAADSAAQTAAAATAAIATEQGASAA